jgi:hypothetical protein
MRHLISVIGWKIIGRLGGYLRRGLGEIIIDLKIL